MDKMVKKTRQQIRSIHTRWGYNGKKQDNI